MRTIKIGKNIGWFPLVVLMGGILTAIAVCYTDSNPPCYEAWIQMWDCPTNSLNENGFVGDYGGPAKPKAVEAASGKDSKTNQPVVECVHRSFYWGCNSYLPDSWSVTNSYTPSVATGNICPPPGG